jgi:hypothetical protein
MEPEVGEWRWNVGNDIPGKISPEIMSPVKYPGVLEKKYSYVTHGKNILRRNIQGCRQTYP